MRQKSGNYCELVLDIDALGKMTMLNSLERRNIGAYEGIAQSVEQRYFNKSC